MATTKEDLGRWFDNGLEAAATWMLVVCDTFSHEDYPVYVQGGESHYTAARTRCSTNMQRVMEVYDLRGDKALQLAEYRADHSPSNPAPKATKAPAAPRVQRTEEDSVFPVTVIIRYEYDTTVRGKDYQSVRDAMLRETADLNTFMRDWDLAEDLEAFGDVTVDVNPGGYPADDPEEEPPEHEVRTDGRVYGA